jgi:hypothetical protein
MYTASARPKPCRCDARKFPHRLDDKCRELALKEFEGDYDDRQEMKMHECWLERQRG